MTALLQPMESEAPALQNTSVLLERVGSANKRKTDSALQEQDCSTSGEPELDNQGDICKRARKMQDKNRKAQVSPSASASQHHAQLQYGAAAGAWHSPLLQSKARAFGLQFSPLDQDAHAPAGSPRLKLTCPAQARYRQRQREKMEGLDGEVLTLRTLVDDLRKVNEQLKQQVEASEQQCRASPCPSCANRAAQQASAFLPFQAKGAAQSGAVPSQPETSSQVGQQIFIMCSPPFVPLSCETGGKAVGATLHGAWPIGSGGSRRGSMQCGGCLHLLNPSPPGHQQLCWCCMVLTALGRVLKLAKLFISAAAL